LKEPSIAKEGLKLIIPSFVLFIVLAFFTRIPFLALFVLLFCFFCVFFFRNPKRHSSLGPECLISPADGTVSGITTVMESEFLGTECQRISIFMSPVDVHVNRAPCDGRIVSMVHRAGEFALAFKKNIEQDNERNYILMDHGGEKILLVQIAGFLARRIIPYVKVGDSLNRGNPLGIIAFGSRVDIYFPKEYESMVQLREKVKAGETMLAKKRG
jgi:phosphatidylserine decarboxylase